MMPYSDFVKHEIGLEILAYFLKNPDAKDTLRGIVDWWLLETYIRKQYALVKKALSELVNQELIIEVQNTSAQPLYQINKEKIQEIQERLKDRPQSSS
jgi:hypothetical protein